MSAAEHPGEAWDTAALASIGRAMGEVNRAFWGPRQRSRWFAFGGCLFWLVLIYVVALYYLIKFELWAIIQAALLVLVVGVLIGGGCWRGYRRLRHRPVGQPALLPPVK